MRTLNVIGCGRVGTTLAALFHRHGACEVQDLYSRNLANTQDAARTIEAGNCVAQISDMRPADIWMLSVPDAHVASVASSLSAHVSSFPHNLEHPTAFHCSGFLPASTLEPLQMLQWSTASVHPVFNFAEPARCIPQFKGTPCGLEGNDKAVVLLSELLGLIGAKCFSVHTESKPLYHAAAVFSSNFLSVIQAIAREAWSAAGVPENLIPIIHESLLRGSVENLLAIGPAKAITGPAARGDTIVVNTQRSIVTQWHPEAGDIYQRLSLLARRLSTTGSTINTEDLK